MLTIAWGHDVYNKYVKNILGMINIKFRIVAISRRKKHIPGGSIKPACQHIKHETWVRS